FVGVISAPNHSILRVELRRLNNHLKI
ncbi:MAG: hypothetical protein ACJATP_003775, partial [Candidatus Azotimanducaceae bacterium]